jgi:hypothetical protein
MGKQPLAPDLPKKRRCTEVSVPYSGGGGAIGWHNNTLNINVRVRLHVGAPLAAHVALILHVPLILKAKVMAAQILQGDALKGLAAPWFVPPIVIPIMLAASIVGSALYRAYS